MKAEAEKSRTRWKRLLSRHTPGQATARLLRRRFGRIDKMNKSLFETSGCVKRLLHFAALYVVGDFAHNLTDSGGVGGLGVCQKV